MAGQHSAAGAFAKEHAGTELAPGGPRLGEPPHEAGGRSDAAPPAHGDPRAVLDAMLGIASGLDLEPALRRVVRAATELAHARYAVLDVLDEQGHRAASVSAGTDPRIRSFPHHPSGSGFAAVPVRGRGTVLGTLSATRDSGEFAATADFTAEDEAVLEVLATAAGTAIDNARRFERSRLREHRLSAAAEIDDALLRGASVESALELLVHRGGELTGATGTLLLTPDTSGALVAGVSAGERAAPLGGLELDPGGDSTVVRVMHAGEPRVFAELASALPRDPLVAQADLGPAAVLPLPGESGAGGVLIAAKEKGARSFSAEELSILASLAERAASALEFAGKQHRQRSLDLLADREHLAGHLHEHVIRPLSATGLNLEGTVCRIDDEHARSRIEEAVDQLDHTVREIRTSIFDLHPGGGQGAAGLRRRLLDVVSELSSDTAVSPSVRVSRNVDSDVAGRTAEHAEAVLREALSNAIRHSGAEHIRIAVAVSAGRLTVEVTDDGIGIPDTARHSGLANLRGRASRCGGELVLDDEPGGGTHLLWSVPVD